MQRITLQLCALALCVAGLSAVIAAQEPAPGQTFHLAKIEFVGLQRLKPDEAVTASGLTVGQSVTPEALDAAANTLVQTGLFKNLSYGVKGKAEAITVTFTVEENTVRLPVVFDNFIWFTDDELIAAVRHEVPGYDGTAPESGETVEGIKRALMSLLRKKQIAGSVDFSPSANAALKVENLRFTYTGDALNVCSLGFPGAAEIEESVLQRQARLLVGKEYSRAYTLGVARESLMPLYRKRGMLKAVFPAAQGRPLPASEQCPNGGVAVTVAVEEGFIYHLSTIDWAGNSVLEAPELNHAFDMHTGDLADGPKLDAAFDAVRKAYGKKGYVLAVLKPELEFDDEHKTVGYRTAVVEGDQFLMGTLTINGLPPAETERLKAAWRLHAGDVFDATYWDGYKRVAIVGDRELGEYLHARGMDKIDAAFKPNREKRTMEVTISFVKP
jgi:outer membrane protein insertion porin family